MQVCACVWNMYYIISAQSVWILTVVEMKTKPRAAQYIMQRWLSPTDSSCLSSVRPDQEHCSDFWIPVMRCNPLSQLTHCWHGVVFFMRSWLQDSGKRILSHAKITFNDALFCEAELHNKWLQFTARQSCAVIWQRRAWMCNICVCC